jgi:competence protein ComEC
MPNTSRGHYTLLLFTLILLVINIYLFRLDFTKDIPGLTFVMLDVGQGDALFIESPTGTQILIDAGPARKVLGPLSRVMSPFDRHIDAIVITNPDADHIGGFLDILKRYNVDQVFEPGTLNDSRIYQNLETQIENKKIEKILARKGMRLDLGGGVIIDILFPDHDVSSWTANDGSVVAKLQYGETSIMLTGDSTAKTEKIILDQFTEQSLDSTILKVGHHGSRTSSSIPFVKEVSPEYALISDGKDNKYGHPHQDTLGTLLSVSAKILRTDLLGTIIMQSDGKNVSFSYKN